MTAIDVPATGARGNYRGTGRPARSFRVPAVPAPLEKAAAPLAQLLAEHERIRVALSEATATTRASEAALAAAQREDSANYAAALRSGKADPGKPREEEVLAAQAAARRKAAALTLTLRSVESDIARLRQASAEEWATAAQDAATPATEAARQALRAFAAAQHDLDVLGSFASWATGQPAPAPRTLPALSTGNRTVTVPMAVAALMRAVEEAAQAPTTNTGAGSSAEADADAGDDEADGDGDGDGD